MSIFESDKRYNAELIEGHSDGIFSDLRTRGNYNSFFKKGSKFQQDFPDQSFIDLGNPCTPGCDGAPDTAVH